MDTVKLLICCLLCTTLVFAQQPLEENPFNTLRGFAYNPYGTLGMAPTIRDILQKPSDIYGHKFVYVLPASGSGYSAFDLAGGSALLGFDQLLMVGYAKSYYGLLLRISPKKYCRKEYDNYECFSNEDYIGLNFSVPLGNSILYASTNKTTIKVNKDTITSKTSTSIGITGGNVLVWDSKVVFDRSNYKSKAHFYDGFERPGIVESDLTRIGPDFYFDLGYKVLQSDRFKFIAGLNNRFFWRYMKDRLNYSYFYIPYPTPEDYSFSNNTHYISITVSPNFLGEVILTGHLLAFVGARHNILYYMWLSEDYYYDMEIRYFSINNLGSGAYTGLRYERKNWAIETRLEGDVFGKVLSGNNPFISFGGFIWLMI